MYGQVRAVGTRKQNFASGLQFSAQILPPWASTRDLLTYRGVHYVEIVLVLCSDCHHPQYYLVKFLIEGGNSSLPERR